MSGAERALVFDIKRDASEDGPGIRTTVFFKGCPLACAWCHNPEGIDPAPSHTWSGGPEAAQPIGRWLSLEQLLYRLLIDRPFFRSTGGGVTLSGGEPTRQMRFIGRLLRRLKEEGIDTAIETCGVFNYPHFAAQVLPWVDRIYYDLKLLDEAAHRHWTGLSNRPVLANLARLADAAGAALHVRVPLVPGVTATPENLGAIGGWLTARGIGRVSLLPYNPLWQEKLARLGRHPRLPSRGYMSPAEQSACVGMLLEISSQAKTGG